MNETETDSGARKGTARAADGVGRPGDRARFRVGVRRLGQAPAAGDRHLDPHEQPAARERGHQERGRRLPGHPALRERERRGRALEGPAPQAQAPRRAGIGRAARARPEHLPAGARPAEGPGAVGGRQPNGPRGVPGGGRQQERGGLDHRRERRARPGHDPEPGREPGGYRRQPGRASCRPTPPSSRSCSSDQLEEVQTGVRILRTLAWLLAALAIVLYALAIYLAGARRRRDPASGRDRLHRGRGRGAVRARAGRQLRGRRADHDGGVGAGGERRLVDRDLAAGRDRPGDGALRPRDRPGGLARRADGRRRPGSAAGPTPYLRQPRIAYGRARARCWCCLLVGADRGDQAPGPVRCS